MKPVLNISDCKCSKCIGQSVHIQLLVMNGCMVEVFPVGIFLIYCEPKKALNKNNQVVIHNNTHFDFKQKKYLENRQRQKKIQECNTFNKGNNYNPMKHCQ